MGSEKPEGKDRKAMKNIEAAGIVLYRVAKEGLLFLLLENARHGTWGFPKGHLEPGEDRLAGALRECREETGCAPQKTHSGFMKRSEYCYHPAEEAEPIQKRVYYFLAAEERADITRSSEHANHVWENRLAARKRIQHDSLREILDCAFAAIEATCGRHPPDEEAAHFLLLDVSGPEEMWHNHCLTVADTAYAIAEAVIRRCPELPVDPSWVRAAGMLHDIGRCRDQGMRHPQAGAEILFEHGLEHLAKPCISHWLKGRSREFLSQDHHFTADRLDALFNTFDLEIFTLSEKIISVADSLVQHDQLVRLEDRYIDARARYGDSKWMRDNEAITEQLLAELEELIQEPLYGLLGI
ncbi:MAG: NUDIX domain-containing protein [Planctomycetota bacterium]|jgi:putative nucleotidyltransferase with HDIG domain